MQGEQLPAAKQVTTERVAEVTATPEQGHQGGWKTRWSTVKADEGESLGTNRDGFRKALRATMRSELLNCVKSLPRRTEIPPFNVTMYIESTAQGYVVRHAEVPDEANLDTYASRCIELAFEKNLGVGDGGIEADQLFRITYPIVLNPVPEPSPPQSGP